MNTRILPDSLTRAMQSDGVRITSRWAAIVVTVVMGLGITGSGWLWGLASERGAALTKIDQTQAHMKTLEQWFDKRITANEQQVELLKAMNERMGRVETDVSWIKQTMQRGGRSTPNP